MRRLLILAVCLSIALGAVCGMHAHMERAVDGHSGASVYSIHVEPEIGHAHEADHEQGGEIDVSLLVQLVGSLAVLAALWAIALIGTHLWRQGGSSMLSVPLVRTHVSPPLRRLIYYLHPPSHAPPVPMH